MEVTHSIGLINSGSVEMWISLALNHLLFSPVKKMDHLLWNAVIFAVLGVTSCSSLGSKIESNLTSTNVRHRRGNQD